MKTLKFCIVMALFSFSSILYAQSLPDYQGFIILVDDLALPFPVLKRQDDNDSTPYQITESGSEARNPVVSNDLTTVAFTLTDTGGNSSIYTVRTDGSNQRLLVDLPGYQWPVAWSPDNNKLLIRSDSESEPFSNFVIIFIDGSEPQILMSTQGITGINWLPDSRHIGFAKRQTDSTNDLYTLDTLSGSIAPITIDSVYRGEIAWSPDGTKVAFIGQDGEAYYTDLATGQNVKLTSDYDKGGLFWLGERHLGYYSGAGEVRLVDLDTLIVTPILRVNGFFSYVQPAFALDTSLSPTATPIPPTATP